MKGGVLLRGLFEYILLDYRIATEYFIHSLSTYANHF
jgi:hypothetical protein